MADLRRVSRHYGVDLDLPPESPSYPSCPSSAVIQGRTSSDAPPTDMTGMTDMTVMTDRGEE